MPSRREFLGSVVAAGGAAVVGSWGVRAARAEPPPGGGATAAGGFTLPPLPYDYAALEPHIDEQTMRIHHGKHHQTYVDKLNEALKGHADLASMTVEGLLAKLDTLPTEIRAAVNNHGGGHSNHSIFWTIMGGAGVGGGEPDGDLASAIKSTFASFDGFKDSLAKAAMGRFGSGWAWLCLDGDKLVIDSRANQDSPLVDGIKPIVGIDVWEHAYYLKYQNRRADYVTAWWNVVNWKEAASRFGKAGG